MFGPFATPSEVRRLRGELKAARSLATRLLQSKLAEALAAQMLRRHTRDFEALQEFVEKGVLSRAAIVHKTEDSLAFYRRLIRGYDLAPERILEIGVKGGGSLLLWRALFPQARVVGLDIKPTLKDLPEGIAVVRGDQSDPKALKRLARNHGPFDLVIDDGSHVSEHQRISFVTLSRYLRPGALYVIEDLHTVAKPAGGEVDYGADVWGDFVRAVFWRFQKRPVEELPLHESLRPLLRHVTDMTMGRRQLALRIGEPPEPVDEG
ncbi:Cephalosporin hydroxylase [Tistlia consotensis]|uniref:Cephalosporin hydroxylase n=1 Tax=Tistlia consotensis USBA 355 TaxID=560819 RepID=A0A1Y6CKQ0_9PROT|nr:class I SAM-dependent methyltransferase [Tistlia consotensis]SMF69821.1 Cephalosporin hydroxylase [Tistlia consotensis USBA 355]SNS05261.1 Cephalosporin hydroxylase [Tistlia consotensis]